MSGKNVCIMIGMIGKKLNLIRVPVDKIYGIIELL
jgi:hypothetical protein